MEYCIKILEATEDDDTLEFFSGDPVSVNWGAPKDRNEADYIGMFTAYTDDFTTPLWRLDPPAGEDSGLEMLMLSTGDFEGDSMYFFAFLKHADDGTYEVAAKSIEFFLATRDSGSDAQSRSGEYAPDYVVPNEGSEYSEDRPPLPIWINFQARNDYISDVIVFDRGEDSVPDGYIVVPNDLNAGNSGKDFRIAYKPAAADSGERALTTFGVTYMDADKQGAVPDNCEILFGTPSGGNAELNGGEGDNLIYVYVGYDEDWAPIRDIGAMDREEEEVLPPGYHAVHYTAGLRDADVNGGTRGDDVYLYYARAGDQILYEGNVLGLRTNSAYYVSMRDESSQVTLSPSMRENECVYVRVDEGNQDLVSLCHLPSRKYIATQKEGEVCLSDAMDEWSTYELGLCAGRFVFRNLNGVTLKVPQLPEDEPTEPTAEGGEGEGEGEAADDGGENTNAGAIASNLFSYPYIEDEHYEETGSFWVIAAITDIRVCPNKRARLDACADKYYPYNEDLNEDSGGSFVQLWIRRGGPDAPLTAVSVANMSTMEETAGMITSDDEDEAWDAVVAAKAEATARAAAEGKPPPFDEPKSDEDSEDDPVLIATKRALQPKNWIILESNCNEGTEDGDVLYMQIKRAPLVRAAGKYRGSMRLPIMEFKIVFGRFPEVEPGYELLDYDLNEAAGGAYVYLTYERGVMSAPEREQLRELARIRAAQHREKLRLLRLAKKARLEKFQQEEAAFAIRDDPSEWAYSPYNPETELRGMENAGNTCYIDSTLFSMFSFSGAYDALLIPSGKLDVPEEDSDDIPYPVRHASMRHFLRENVVLTLRDGECIDHIAMDSLRFLLREIGWETMWAEEFDLFALTAAQQDASEFFGFLIDQLGAPYLGTVRGMSYKGIPDPDATSALETYRSIAVPVPLPVKRKAKATAASRKKKKKEKSFLLSNLIGGFFFDNPLEDFKRDIGDALAKLVADADAAAAVAANVPTPGDNNGDGGEAAGSSTPGKKKKKKKEVPPWSMEYRLLPYYLNEKTEKVEWNMSPLYSEIVGEAAPPPPPVVVPVIIKRFNNNLDKLSCPIHVTEVVDATDFMAPPPQGEPRRRYQLKLRSVVCHAGRRLDMGHYYAFAAKDTVDEEGNATRVWYKFDDLEDDPGKVVESDVFAGLDEDGAVTIDYYDLVHECFLCLFELEELEELAGDSSLMSPSRMRFFPNQNDNDGDDEGDAGEEATVDNAAEPEDNKA